MMKHVFAVALAALMAGCGSQSKDNVKLFGITLYSPASEAPLGEFIGQSYEYAKDAKEYLFNHDSDIDGDWGFKYTVLDDTVISVEGFCRDTDSSADRFCECKNWISNRFGSTSVAVSDKEDSFTVRTDIAIIWCSKTGGHTRIRAEALLRPEEYFKMKSRRDVDLSR